MRKVNAKSVEQLDLEFCCWLAGLVDGEGSLQLKCDKAKRKWWSELTISLRDDERPMLEMIQKKLGRGACYLHVARSKPQLRSKPRYMLRFHNASDTRFFVDLFERYPLRSKKKQVFKLWAEARKELNKPSFLRDQLYLKYLYRAIRQTRNYEGLKMKLFEPEGKQIAFDECSEGKCKSY